MNFGIKLRKLRKNANYTQKQLADRLGVAKSVVSFYESGDRFPSYDVLIKIARTFHVSTDYLLGIDNRRYIEITDLSEEHIAVLDTVANALRHKKNSKTKS